jgi:DNA primase large subunit
MNPLRREDLFSLEKYAEQRAAFRARVLEHKQDRRVDVGPNLSLYFEDRLTIQYQVQEMLRIERIFEADAIEEELEAYNPLIPDGSNLKCTAMLEFGDVAERRERLAQLVGIENLVWLRVEGYDKVYAIANEDLERSTDEKTSAVHFMRFELTAAMIDALRAGATLSFGSDHTGYPHSADVSAETRAALQEDLV